MGNHFDKSFKALGAECLYELGVCNAETFSTEEDFFKWKAGLWPAICDKYRVTDTTSQAQLQQRKNAIKNKLNDAEDSTATIEMPFVTCGQDPGKDQVDKYDLNLAMK